MNRNGMLIAGNWIIDQVKIIDCYPEEEKLVNISTEYTSNGGSAYNLVKNIFKLGLPIPLGAIGLIGTDEKADRILQECSAMNIDLSQLKTTREAGTSYTDVMSVKATGKRTFFHYRGANALLNEKHFDFSQSQAKLFHLGYLLLLDKLDELNSKGETGAMQVLKQAKHAGFRTSVDIVSESSNRFKTVIPPSLPYIDYLFINEYEAEMLSGVATRDNSGTVNLENCLRAAKQIVKMGLSGWVILHYPKGAIAINYLGEELFQPALKIESEEIVGAVGAGDAFAAGVLSGIHQNWPMKLCLELGVCAAASSLFAATSSDGLLPVDACLDLAKTHGYV